MADFLEEYKKSGLAVRVWTVNEKDQMSWLIREGVDAVITNYPDRGIEARAEAEAELANDENKKLFLLDIDGTVCKGEQLIGGTREFLSYLKSCGGQFVFITNNARKALPTILLPSRKWGFSQIFQILSLHLTQQSVSEAASQRRTDLCSWDQVSATGIETERDTGYDRLRGRRDLLRPGLL